MNYVDELRDLADVIDAEDSEATAMELFADRALAWQQESRDDTGEELSFAEIDRRIGRGNDYTGRIVRWRTSGAAAATPFADPGRRERKDVGPTKATLAKANDEQLDEIVRSLPPERREALKDAVQRDGAQDAVDTSLDVQVAKALTQLARVDVLLREGKQYSNMDAKKVERTAKDIDHGQETLGNARDRLPAQGVRKVA